MRLFKVFKCRVLALIIRYFVRGTLPEGHNAIFEYINSQVGKKQP